MRLFIVSLFIASLSMGGLQAHAQSKLYYPDGFPERGHEVLATLYADANITSITGGGTNRMGDRFYVWGTIAGKKLELTLDEFGEVVEDLRVTELPLDAVPAPCLVSARDKMGDSKIAKAEKIERGDAIEYRFFAEPMTEAERAYFDTLVQSSLSPGPENLGEETSSQVTSQKVVWTSPEGEVLKNHVRYHLRRNYTPTEEKH